MCPSQFSSKIRGKARCVSTLHVLAYLICIYHGKRLKSQNRIFWGPLYYGDWVGVCRAVYLTPYELFGIPEHQRILLYEMQRVEHKVELDTYLFQWQFLLEGRHLFRSFSVLLCTRFYLTGSVYTLTPIYWLGPFAASNIFLRPSIPDMASTFFLQSLTSTVFSCWQHIRSTLSKTFCAKQSIVSQ